MYTHANQTPVAPFAVFSHHFQHCQVTNFFRLRSFSIHKVNLSDCLPTAARLSSIG